MNLPEIRRQNLLVEPNFKIGSQKPLIEILRYAPAKLYLSQHVANSNPRHSLVQKIRI